MPPKYPVKSVDEYANDPGYQKEYTGDDHSKSIYLGDFAMKGVRSAESSHTRWGLGKGIPRQPYPCKILSKKFCKEAGSNPGPTGQSGEPLPVHQVCPSLGDFTIRKINGVK